MLKRKNRQDAPATPLQFVRDRMADLGVSLQQPQVRCTGLRKRDQSLEGQPVLYDQQLVKTLLEDSSQSVIENLITPENANAQNLNGETLLMKICRHIVDPDRDEKRSIDMFWVLDVLLKKGADPLVCCDSGKTVLHDLFWAAKPPPAKILESMEATLKRLHAVSGREGLLRLLLWKDRHGLTPAEYIKREQHLNWKAMLTQIVDWAAEPSTDEDSGDQQEGAKKQRTNITNIDDAILGVMMNYPPLSQILNTLDSKHRELLGKLDERQSSYLLSDLSDPDCIITHCSKAFCEASGYPVEEVVGQNCRFLQGPNTDAAAVRTISGAIKKRERLQVVLLNYTKKGEEFLNRFMLLPMRVDGEPRYFIGIQNCPKDIADEYGGDCVNEDKVPHLEADSRSRVQQVPQHSICAAK